MWETVVKYSSVLFVSMFKFLFGPVFGYSYHLNIWESIILTALGSILSVIIISFIGISVKKRITDRMKRRGKYKLFTRKNRKIVRVWSKFGIKGIAFITPVILTPIGGTIVALSFGVKRPTIIFHMSLSILFWSPPTTFIVYQLQKGASSIFNFL